MERYMEMGFEEDDAREATERFGDDLHAGCHWLMVRHRDKQKFRILL